METKISYTFDQTGVQCGKFAAVVATQANFTDGFSLPGAQNAANVLGIVQEGVVPDGFSEYSGGSYAGVSNAAWPANALPANGLGMKKSIMRQGVSKAVAAGAINRGDALVVADNQGRVASIVTLALAGGTQINVVGFAEEPAVNPNDVLRIFVNPTRAHV